MYKFKYILALISIFCLPGLGNAQTPRAEIEELSGMMRSSILYNSQKLERQKTDWLKGVNAHYPAAQRYQSWALMRRHVQQGEPEGALPGAVTSWMMTFPHDCPSVMDFRMKRGAPETNGIHTSDKQTKARFPDMGWVRYEATGNAGAIKPLQVMDSQGLSAFYLVTRIVVESRLPIEATLEMPSSTQIVAWLNGHRVLEKVDGNLPEATIFGDRFDIELQPGDNILAVKVASLEKAPEFYTFLSDRKTGAPVPFRIDNGRPIDTGELEGAKTLAPKQSILSEIYNYSDTSPAMRSVMARLIYDEVSADGVVQNILLSETDKTAHMVPSELEIATLAVGKPDKNLLMLRKAIEINPDDPQLRLIYINEVLRASAYYGDNVARFTDEWNEMKQMIPAHAPVVEGRSYETMLERIMAQVQIISHHPVTAYQNIEKSGCSEDCKDVLLQLVQGTLDYYGNRGKYQKAVETLSENHQDISGYIVEKMRIDLKNAVESGNGRQLVHTLAQIQQRTEKYLSLHPYDDYMWLFWLDILNVYGLDAPDMSEEKLHLLQDAGFNADADSRYQMFLALRPNDAERWLKYANFALNRGLYEESAEAYHMASQIRPQDDSISERAVAVRLMQNQNAPEKRDLSDSDSAIIASFEKPYTIKDIPANHYENASGVVNVLHNRVVRVLPDGLTSTFTQIAFDVLDDQGLKVARNNGVYYSPNEEKVEIVAVIVTKQDGSVRKLYHSREYETGDDEYKLFYDNRYISIEVPDLAVGDRVEYRFKRTTLQKTASSVLHFSDVFQLQGQYDQQWHRYTVIAPENLNIHFSLHQPDLKLEPAPVTTRREKDTIVTTFEQKDMPRYIPEQGMPGMSEVIPMLFVSSFGSWKEILDWNFDLVKPQWQINDDIRNEVRKLTAGVDDRLEKLKRIHAFVVKSTRYVGLEYGIHGVKPYPVAQIFERRFGDCKDKASLLKVMLDEAGIPANYTVIRTIDSGDVNPAQPMPYYFNHAIVYVPEFDLFLDGTAEFSGIRELPQMDQGGFAFVMKDDGTYQLTHAPVSTSNDNITKEEIVFDLTQKDRIPYTLTRQIHGADASQYRFRYQVKDLQHDYFEASLSKVYPGSKVENVSFSDLDDLNKDIRVEATAVTGRNDLLKSEGKAWFVYPLGMTNHILSALAPLASRHTPMVGVLPRTQTKLVSWKLPADVKVDLPEPVSETSPFGKYEIRSSMSHQVLTTEVKFELTQYRIMPDEYKSYVDFLQKFENKVNTMYRIEVEHE